MIRHGRRARVEVGRALANYRGEEPEVLVPLVQATMKAGSWQSLPRLFQLMEHSDPRIRGKAGAAASGLMGADYYFRADDSPEKREEILARMRVIYERMKPDLQRVYGDGP
jgi:hypothetical protein